MIAVRHYAEQCPEPTQLCREATQHDAQQLTEIGPLLGGRGIHPPLDPLQASRRRASNLFQYGNAAFHVGRIPATTGRLKRVGHQGHAFRQTPIDDP